ncbi:hypothetical protein BJX70DRAFT_366920 [Aspergillus crustosus]
MEVRSIVILNHCFFLLGVIDDVSRMLNMYVDRGGARVSPITTRCLGMHAMG